MSQPNYESEVKEQRARGFSDEGNNGVLSAKKKKIAKAITKSMRRHKEKEIDAKWSGRKITTKAETTKSKPQETGWEYDEWRDLRDRR